MNTTELIAFARTESGTSDENLDYTDSVILDLLNQQMRLTVEPIVASTRAGYWFQTLVRQGLGVNNPYVRLPPRTCALEMAEISLNAGLSWRPLDIALESDESKWLLDYGNLSHPVAYTVRGTSLTLIPAAKAANIWLKVKVVYRPSKLVMPEVTGLIVDVDYDARTLTVNAMPSGVAGTVICDVIQPRDCFELPLADAVMTVDTPTQLTVAAGYGMSRIEVGDYVRLAETSDWPQLPESFHPLVGTLTAINISNQRELYEREQKLTGKATAQLTKLEATLTPRVKSSAHRPTLHDWL